MKVRDHCQEFKEFGKRICIKTKQLFPAKILKQTCLSICRQNCSDKISEDTRQKLFDA